MATSFDGIGMSQLGSERRFMTGDNPFSQGLKGLKDFTVLSAMDKSGLVEFLNDLGKQKEEILNKSKSVTGAAEPYTIKPIMAISPDSFTTPYQPQISPENQSNQPFGGGFFNNANQQQQKSIQDAADEAMNLTKSSSFTSPNEFEKTNQSESQAILAQANQPAAPPGGMMLPQYGKKQGGDGDQIAGAILSFLPKLFGMA